MVKTRRECCRTPSPGIWRQGSRILCAVLALALLIWAPAANAQTSETYTVSANSDDADERPSDGNMWVGDTYSVVDNYCGARFQNVTIPAGATITSATLEIFSYGSGTTSFSVDIVAQDADFPPTFNTTAYNLSSRPRTSAQTSWVTGSTTYSVGQSLTSPDFSSVVQQVVDRPGWSSGNSLAVIIIPVSGAKNYWKRAGNSSYAPQLHVTYTTGASSSGTELLLITSNATPNAQESLRKSQFESWGYSVTTLEDSSSQPEYDAALATAVVVYVPEEVFSSEVSYKLREATIGIVNEERCLNDAFGMSTSDGSGITSAAITISDNTHYISKVFSTGALTITSSSQNLTRMNATLASGLQTLATSSGFASLAVVEQGETLANSYNGSSVAFGRRVLLPFGGDSFDFGALNSNGLSLLERAIAWAAGLDDSLVAHWKLDDESGVTAIDASPNGNHGTLDGSPTWTTDAIRRGALDFESSDGADRVDAGNFSVEGEGLTLAAWIRQEDPSNDGRVIIKSSGNSQYDQSWGLTVDQNGELDFRVTAGGTWRRLQAPGTISPGVWRHIAGTYDGTTMRLYLDGKLIKSMAHSPGGSISADASETVTLGDSITGGRPFDGEIDDARVYNAALSAAEIAELYGLVGHWKLDESSGTVANDSSGLGNHGTHTGPVTVNAAGPYPGRGAVAAEYSGVSGHTELLDLQFDFSDGFAAAFWVKPTSTPAAGQFQAFLDLGNGTNADEVWLGWVQTAGFQLYMTDTADSASLHTIEDNQGFEANEWVHCVAVVDSSGNATLYRDGHPTKSGFYTSLPTNVERTVNSLANSPLNDFFAGNLHDVRLYNRPLSHAEVTQLYGLVAHWKLDETSGSTAYDSSGMGNDAILTGTQGWTTNGQISGGHEFDYTNGEDYFTAPSNSVLDELQEGDYSITAWFKPNSIPPGTGSDTDAGYGILLKQGWHIGLFYSADGELVMDDWLTGGNWNGVGTWGEVYSSGTFRQIAGVVSRAEGTMKIYVDGSLMLTETFTPGAAPVDFGSEQWKIGIGEPGNAAWGYPCDGVIDDARLYNRALSDSEVLQLYQAGQVNGLRIIQWVEAR